jgi:nucleoid-associated protein YgaU
MDERAFLVPPNLKQPATREDASMGLRDKYNHAVQTAKQLRMDGSAEERDGKLHFNGTVTSVDEKNQIWNALKTVPGWEKDVVADIKVRAAAPQHAPGHQNTPGQATAQPSATAATTYTVQPGDTLSAIAKRFLGNASDYMEIFNANKDQLTDPDKIKPGQVLKIPQPARG